MRGQQTWKRVIVDDWTCSWKPDVDAAPWMWDDLSQVRRDLLRLDVARDRMITFRDDVMNILPVAGLEMRALGRLKVTYSIEDPESGWTVHQFIEAVDSLGEVGVHGPVACVLDGGVVYRPDSLSLSANRSQQIAVPEADEAEVVV